MTEGWWPWWKWESELAGGRREATMRHPWCLGRETRQMSETGKRFDEKSSLEAKPDELFS